MGYVPSEAGRALSTRTTRQVAMVADLDNPLYPALVTSVHDALLELDYRMVVLAERGDDLATYGRLLDRSVDGAILTTSLRRSSLPLRLAERGLPFVQLNRTSDLVDVDSVAADNCAGAHSATQLLLDLGHRRIGALLGPDSTSTGREREAGLRSALTAAGVRLPQRWAHRGWFTDRAGFDGFHAVMAGAVRPTAVVCSNDAVAIGALNAAAELGIAVPAEVSVVGFDDLPMAGWPILRLTTVRVDLSGMAARAARMLVARLAGDHSAARHERFPTCVVARDTHCAPARRGAAARSTQRRAASRRPVAKT